MDRSAVQSSIDTNIAKSSPTDYITDVELREVLENMLTEEAVSDGATTANLSFQSRQGTIYLTTLTSTTVNIVTTGDVIGWDMVFKHNAASLAITRDGTAITLLNPDQYRPSSVNYIAARLLDTGVLIAWVFGGPVEKISKGNQSIEATSTQIQSSVNSYRWLDVQHLVNGPVITIGKPDDAAGVRFILENISSAIRFQVGTNQFFAFNMISGAFTIFKLASTEADAAPVKFIGVTTNGTVVKFNPITYIPLATTDDPGLMSSAHFDKVENAIETDGTGLTAGDIIKYDGTQFIRDPFEVDPVDPEINLNSLKGNMYGISAERSDASFTVQNPVVGGSALIRSALAVAGGPAFTGTGITITKVGDWTTGYSTSKVNHINLVAVSATQVYAYLAGNEP